MKQLELKMPNSETLERLLKQIEEEGVGLEFTDTENIFLETLASLRLDNYEDFTKYFLKYKSLRKWLMADYYD